MAEDENDSKRLAFRANGYTPKYYYIIWLIRARMELYRSDFEIQDDITVDTFQDSKANDEIMLKIFNHILETEKFEASWNQTANAINIFLKGV